MKAFPNITYLLHLSNVNDKEFCAIDQMVNTYRDGKKILNKLKGLLR